MIFSSLNFPGFKNKGDPSATDSMQKSLRMVPGLHKNDHLTGLIQVSYLNHDIRSSPKPINTKPRLDIVSTEASQI